MSVVYGAVMDLDAIARSCRGTRDVGDVAQTPHGPAHNPPDSPPLEFRQVLMIPRLEGWWVDEGGREGGSLGRGKGKPIKGFEGKEE